MGKFWSDASTEPKRSFRWFMVLGGEGPGNQIETYAVKTVKKPSYAITEVPHQYIAHTFYYPGRVTWNTVDVTFVDPVIPDQSVVITNMFARAGYKSPVNAEQAKTSLSKQGFKTSVGQPTIHQIDADGTVIETWTLINAFFTSVDYGQLDYGSEDLVINSVTIRYDYANLSNTSTPSLIPPGK